MSQAAKPAQAIEVFFCYAHEDEYLRDQLEKQLKILQRQALISSWHDRRISAGMEWGREIAKYLNIAQIILLLVSPDFISSDYCYDIEMERALERHEAGEACVIPIILRPTLWQEDTPFSKLQVLPTDGKPVTTWLDRDEAFLDIAKGLKKTAKELQSSKIDKQSSIKGPDHNLIPSNEDPFTNASKSSLPKYPDEAVKPEHIFQKLVEPHSSSEPESEETKLRVVRKHWWFLVLPFLPFLGAFVALFILLRFAFSLPINQSFVYVLEGAIGLTVIITGFQFVFRGIVDWWRRTYTLTNKRIITPTGKEIPMRYVQQIGVDQDTLWAILLGYGTLSVYYSGGGHLIMKGISQPREVRDLFEVIVVQERRKPNQAI